ncbi:MAG: VOC family protein [Christensenellales bacterium]|jgi:predicted enzyme related to lactoylglutathione lyase
MYEKAEIKERKQIALKFHCVNISSKGPKALAVFYRAIGAPVFVENDRYDDWKIGDPKKGGSVCIWDENRWGKSTAGHITIVLNADDVQSTYEEIKSRGIETDPPKTADWGGKELVLRDPDGNIVMIL